MLVELGPKELLVIVVVEVRVLVVLVEVLFPKRLCLQLEPCSSPHLKLIFRHQAAAPSPSHPLLWLSQV